MNQIESWDTPVCTNGDLSSMSKSMTIFKYIGGQLSKLSNLSATISAEC